MTFSAGIRRVGTIGFALLLFVAAVGPSCLMSAMPAMAAPMHTTAPDPMDCDRDAGGSLASCPHSAPAKAAYDFTRFDDVQPFVLTSAFEAPSPLVSFDRLYPRAEREPSPPPSLKVPLRL